MNLNKSRKALDTAQQKIEAMKNSQSMDEHEEDWRAFLGYLEKVWVKAERECQGIRKKFEPWQGKYKRLRKKDQLLKYLKHARHADEHSIQEIVDKSPAQLAFSPTKSGILRIKKLKVSKRRIEYEGDPVKVKFSPARVKAVQFSNKGQTYFVPEEHDASPIQNNDDPIILAELGFNFYKNFLDETEKKFFN